MRRFWIFPLIMGISVWLFPILSLVENLIVLIGTKHMLDFHSGPAVSSADIIYPCIGAIFGLGFAMYDVWRNGFVSPQEHSLARRLIGNIAWCWLYAGIFNLLNSIAFRGFFVLANPSQDLYWLPVVPVGVAVFLNFVATFWAAIRSVNTNNILVPRVIRHRFKPLASVD